MSCLPQQLVLYGEDIPFCTGGRPLLVYIDQLFRVYTLTSTWIIQVRRPYMYTNYFFWPRHTSNNSRHFQIRDWFARGPGARYALAWQQWALIAMATVSQRQHVLEVVLTTTNKSSFPGQYMRIFYFVGFKRCAGVWLTIFQDHDLFIIGIKLSNTASIELISIQSRFSPFRVFQENVIFGTVWQPPTK